jgi:predicted RNase H-like HicB family nuclease
VDAGNLPLWGSDITALEALDYTGSVKERRSRAVQYLVVVEKGESGFGAYIPDLPGCIAVGDSEAEVLSLIREAIELHLEDLREQGEAVPSPSSKSALIEVDAA